MEGFDRVAAVDTRGFRLKVNATESVSVERSTPQFTLGDYLSPRAILGPTADTVSRHFDIGRYFDDRQWWPFS